MGEAKDNVSLAPSPTGHRVVQTNTVAVYEEKKTKYTCI